MTTAVEEHMGSVKKLAGTKCKKDRVKSTTLRKDDGYMVVTLYKNNQQKTKYLHRIILEAFVGPCPDDQECRHLDGIKINNILPNLSWGTYSENAQDTLKHGSHFQPDCRGSRHGQSKLTEEDIPKIRQFLASGILQKDVAKRFGVSQTIVSLIKRSKIWRHVDE